MKFNKFDATQNPTETQTRPMNNTHINSSLPSVGVVGPCFAKFLVTDIIAGSIIGKNGTVINQIEKEYNCNLRLSNNGSYFPGTSQRICVIAGEHENVHNAMSSILLKIKESFFPSKGTKENYFKQTQEQIGENNNILSQQTTIASESVFEPSNRFTFTMVIPFTSVSVIIGKKGENIKNLAVGTSTKLLISDNSTVQSERLINMTGNGDSILSAASSIIQITQTDPSIKSCWNLDYRVNNPYEPVSDFVPSKTRQYTSSKANTDLYPYNGISMPVLSHNCEIKFEIPDSAVGTIIGKQGLALSGISRRSGAKISISQKGDLVPGTNCRYVHLSGQLASIHQAHALLIQQYMSFTETQDSYNETTPLRPLRIPSVRNTFDHFPSNNYYSNQ